tara:strand:+ start:176 stop:961 length:786 start_codon:yes stop_codon:yes gene_type:complete
MIYKKKKVLITGGTHGIGLAISEILAKKKFDIATFSRSQSRINQFKKKMRKYKIKTSTKKLDVLNNISLDNYFNDLKKNFGNIDILINNVGGGGSWGKEYVENTNYKVWSDVLEKNVGVAIKLIKLSIPHMKKKKWGRVITIASVAAKRGMGRPWYVLAKKAEITLTKTLSVKRDLVRKGITFNSISPGAIMIPNTGWFFRKKENPKKFSKFINDKFPLGRLGKPEEIASIVPFLCTDESRFINGADIVIDGGQSNEEYED